MSTKTNTKLPVTETLRYILKHQLRYPGLLFGMFGSLPLAVLVNRYLPALVVAGVLDRLSSGDYTKGDLWGSFGTEILIAGALWAVGGIGLWRVVGYFNWRLEGHVLRDMSNEMFAHLMRLGANFHANHFAGSLVSQANKLTSATVRITDTTLFSLGTLISAVVITAVILLPRAPLFVLFYLIFVSIYMACGIFLTRKLRVYNSDLASAENVQTGYLADSLTNVMAVKSFAAGKQESVRYAASAEKSRLKLMKLMRATMLREYAFTSVGTSLNVISLVMAAVSVMFFENNVGTVFLILSYVNNTIINLWDFSTTSLRNYNRAFGDAEGMMEVLATEVEVKDPAEPEKPRIKEGAINFKDMHFTHPDSRQDDSLFVNLNLDIKASEKIGLVGHSGSGKTTLTKLLLRFNDIDDGEILIDGQNIANLTQDDLRRHIAYVPQEPLLFHRSIRENIAFGQPGLPDSAVIEAAKKAYAHDFILKLPQGYDTLVGERGVKLSGGQRQRIAIARAILKDAPILVLDEATSALDSESEKLIQAALWKLMEGRTAIVIAHRLSTIQKMDRIVVLEDGEITEQGTHQELLKQKGIYATLWEHQSGGFIQE